MAAEPRLPRVELFTTGPACGLCERTHADLVALGAGRRFVLLVVDLRDRPEGVPPDYVVRAPVVHRDGVRVAEGRIDRRRLARALEDEGPGSRGADRE
jgi:hypothetical protein